MVCECSVAATQYKPAQDFKFDGVPGSTGKKRKREDEGQKGEELAQEDAGRTVVVCDVRAHFKCNSPS